MLNLGPSYLKVVICVGFSLVISISHWLILPVVLYGCEVWSVTLREKRRLTVFENRILRRIFGPKRDKNGAW